MGKAVVLDASAMLALIQREPGYEHVVAAMGGDFEVFVSAVNFGEVATKLVRDGGSRAQVADAIEPFLASVVDFTAPQAAYAAELYRLTYFVGLSLGDRVCLALAEERGAVVLTADQAWKKLNVGLEIELIR